VARAHRLITARRCQTPDVRIESFAEADVPTNLRAQVVRLQDLAWPLVAPSGLAAWHDPALNAVSLLLVDDDGRLLSALDILSKPLEHAGETFAASGISAMVTDPDVRGRGHGRALAVAARDFMATNGADLGIFTCDVELRAFYESAGWRHLAGSVLVGGTPQDPFPSDGLDKVVMGDFFTEKGRSAQRTFVGARIELYPGAIDRLW
jgi:aminoglycoside 2'-N-acetyltransferase I